MGEKRETHIQIYTHTHIHKIQIGKWGYKGKYIFIISMHKASEINLNEQLKLTFGNFHFVAMCFWLGSRVTRFSGGKVPLILPHRFLRECVCVCDCVSAMLPNVFGLI